MSAIKNRYELVFLLEARQCNYNGDPDMDNLPRIDFQTNRGFMTDVCLKRRIRDYIADTCHGREGFDIFVRNGQNLNKSIAECVIAASDGEAMVGKKSEEASEVAKRKFYDVRTFGGVMSTGLNAGQVQGAVQFSMPQSYDEVQCQSATLTRLAYADGKFTELSEYDKLDKSMDDDKKRTMGKKSFCSYALFECRAFVSANLAQKNGFSEEDLDLLLEAILNMYEYKTSASKAGMSVVGPVIIFQHVGHAGNNSPDNQAREALLGCAPAQKLFALLSVNKKSDVMYPRSYQDYEAVINTSGLPAGIRVGFKYNAFDVIKWDHIDSKQNEWLKEQ